MNAYRLHRFAHLAYLRIIDRHSRLVESQLTIVKPHALVHDLISCLDGKCRLRGRLFVKLLLIFASTEEDHPNVREIAATQEVASPLPPCRSLRQDESAAHFGSVVLGHQWIGSIVFRLECQTFFLSAK